MLLGNLTKMNKIDKDLTDLQRKTERILWLLEEMKNNKPSKSVVIHKPKHKPKKNYPHKFIRCIKGRYKNIKKIGEELNLTDASVNTYIKLARKDGVVINTRKVNDITEYKLGKDQ